MATEVMNLSTTDTRTYTCDPEKAVIAAYAQSLGDWNTWGYDKYRPLLMRGTKTVACGDWCAPLVQSSPAKFWHRFDRNLQPTRSSCLTDRS